MEEAHSCEQTVCIQVGLTCMFNTGTQIHKARFLRLSDILEMSFKQVRHFPTCLAVTSANDREN